jgi:tetrapyrrole methylase family protein/MazG family protein
MARLRSPDGCPWDAEQTHATLRRYIVEEVYEVLEAIDEQDPAHLCEELGDLLLQIVFHARMAEEIGDFSMQDVIDTVTEKLIRRHPHVFGDISVRDAAEVIVNWDAIKRKEKTARPKSALEGVPKGLPALLRANKLQAKAAKVGFDWDDIAPVWDKVAEELAELREAQCTGDKARIEDELGDVIFAVVNLGRFLGVEAEVALNGTSNRFVRRFQLMEAAVREKGLKWRELDLAAMDELWEAAKATEH